MTIEEYKSKIELLHKMILDCKDIEIQSRIKQLAFKHLIKLLDNKNE